MENLSKNDDQRPKKGRNLGMGVWVTFCAIIGGAIGCYLGLQVNPIAAYIGVMLGGAFGIAFAFYPSF